MKSAQLKFVIDIMNYKMYKKNYNIQNFEDC